MAKLLFTVTDHFDVQGLGVVVAPGIGPEERLLRGDPLDIRRPDGSSLRTHVAGLESLAQRALGTTPILFPLTKADLPLGAEVWSVDP